METKLTKLLNIKLPIIQGAMAWAADAELAAAVSNAGGAGVIAMGGRPTDWAIAEIRKAKSLTDKPFGVNVMLMARNVEEIVQVCCEEKVAFVTLGAGNPIPWLEKFRAAGVKTIPVVPSLKLAKRLEDAGADAIIIEGMEAGGHIGQITTMSLMENVLPVVKSIPVVVAGGICDGRAIAAAMLMGADGVQMGTRFLTSTECNIHPAAKEAVVKATDTDNVTTGYSRNMGIRCLKNAFTERYTAAEISGAPKEELMKMEKMTNKMGLVEGNLENGVVMCSQALAVIHEVLPVAEIMERLIAEAKAAIAHVNTIKFD